MNPLKSRSYAWSVLAALLIFIILNALASPAFLRPDNWNGLLVGATPFMILAMAQAFAVLSGDSGIDLSVGPLAGLVNAVITGILVPQGWTDPVSILLVVFALGIGSGLVNGLMIAFLRVQPIIATLGTFLAYQGMTVKILPQAGGSAPDWLREVARPHLHIPGVLFVLGLIAVAWLALERTAFRRNLLAVGGDARSAYASGVNVASIRLTAYIFSGVLSALGGLVFTAALGSGDPFVGVPYTLTSVAAVALGGVALTGGRGGLLGAGAAGALLFLIQTLFTYAQVSIFFLQIAYGLILLGALALNAAVERLRRDRLASQLESQAHASV